MPLPAPIAQRFLRPLVGGLVYPPPGVADLWTPARRGDDPLASLLGRRRAQVLLEPDRPPPPWELARRLGVGAGSVSGHLTALRRAGR